MHTGFPEQTLVLQRKTLTVLAAAGAATAPSLLAGPAEPTLSFGDPDASTVAVSRRPGRAVLTGASLDASDAPTVALSARLGRDVLADAPTIALSTRLDRDVLADAPTIALSRRPRRDVLTETPTEALCVRIGREVLPDGLLDGPAACLVESTVLPRPAADPRRPAAAYLAISLTAVLFGLVTVPSAAVALLAVLAWILVTAVIEVTALRGTRLTVLPFSAASVCLVAGYGAEAATPMLGVAGCVYGSIAVLAALRIKN